jgi:hypothetical protein
MIVHHQGVIALNLDHLVINVHYVQVIDAFVQFDEEHHHVVGQHDFFRVLIEQLFDDDLRLHDANDPKTRNIKINYIEYMSIVV